MYGRREGGDCPTRLGKEVIFLLILPNIHVHSLSKSDQVSSQREREKRGGKG